MQSIVIPAYNEARVIRESLLKVKRFCGKAAYEVIVVDDGSKDATPSIVRQVAKGWKSCRLIRQPANMGKGAAVRAGMLAAKGDRILFADADMSTPVEELRKLMRVDADVVLGSRALESSNVQLHQPLYRELMGKSFNKAVQVLAVPGIWDTQCGFKLFRRQAAREIFSRARIDGFGFDVETLYLARRLGFSVREVGISWFNNPNSHVHPVKDALRMFRDIFVIHGHALVGNYGD